MPYDQRPAALARLPSQPAGVAWPTADWPVADLPAGADAARVGSALDWAFDSASHGAIGETHALLLVQGGYLVAELYAAGSGPATTRPSWSMAKSLTQALVGFAAADGLVDIHSPAGVAEWSTPGDPRGAITLDQLLRMSSGLAFVEDYNPDHPSDVIEMLFGRGKEDVAGFAASFPLAHAPGTCFDYSSGTTNIVCRRLAEILCLKGEAFAAWMGERLFAPLGMRSATPRFDAAGTFIGSSFCFATPRDFARFGLFYLRGGVWEGRRRLPAAWIDYARAPTAQQPGDEADGRYGAHWWLDLAGPGSFSANGYDGQCIVVCPDRDLVIVRAGATPAALGGGLKAWIRELAEAFASAPSPPKSPLAQR